MKNLILILAIIFGSSSLSIGQLSNTMLGDSSGTSITTGSGNSMVGFWAGQNITTGDDNSFFGKMTGFSNSTGGGNSFFGADAGSQNTTGNENTIIGHNAGFNNTTGIENTYLGSLAGASNATGSNNLCLGAYTGSYNSEGNANTFVGSYSGYVSQTGSMNSNFGAGAGFLNQSGSSNTCIGFLSGFENINGSKNVFLGNFSGYYELGSNKLYIANDSINHLIYGDFSTNQIGINTKDLDTHTLNVNGTARAKEILVKIGWGDYVFHSDYQLPTLAQEAQHIKENGHLSGFQSAEEMNGEIQLGDVTKRQQVKIEEMMLHLIDLNQTYLDKMKALETEIEILKKQ